MANTVGYAQIPVTDMTRAVDFYNNVFGFNLSASYYGGIFMALFDDDPDAYGATGGLVESSELTPSESGVLTYISTSNMGVAIEKVERAGGRIIVQPEPMPTGIPGTRAVIADTEGNFIGIIER